MNKRHREQESDKDVAYLTSLQYKLIVYMIYQSAQHRPQSIDDFGRWDGAVEAPSGFILNVDLGGAWGARIRLDTN